MQGRGPAPVALVGTTASGKSEVAEQVARRCGDVELVSMDAMAVYRGMDIATAKPPPGRRAEVPYHLLDLVEPSEEFTVARFQGAARHVLGDLGRRGRRAVLVGGTGLYLRSVVDDLAIPGRWPELAVALDERAASPEGLALLYARLVELDPVGAGRTTPTNRRRIVRALEVTEGSGRPFSSFGPGLEAYPASRVPLVGIAFDPEVVDRRIAERFERWMAEGLLDEVRGLLGGPRTLSRTARQALGYRELLAHLEEGVPLQACLDAAVRRTRRLARRQWAWFRRDPRIRWVGPDEDPVAVLLAVLGGDEPAHRPGPRSERALGRRG
jgi:tRNA dimethylallyltransferase